MVSPAVNQLIFVFVVLLVTAVMKIQRVQESSEQKTVPGGRATSALGSRGTLPSAPLDVDRRHERLEAARPLLADSAAASSKVNAAVEQHQRIANSRPDTLSVPGWGGAPTADDLLALWLKDGAAKPDKVSLLQEQAAFSARKGSAGKNTTQAGLGGLHQNGLGLRSTFPNLEEKHGVFASAWHDDEGWRDACSPFVNASIAAEESGVAPLLVKVSSSDLFNLGQELQLITLAALVAAGLGRPFRALVEKSHYGPEILNRGVPVDWRLFADDQFGQIGNKSFASSVTEAIKLANISPAETPIFLQPRAADPWECTATTSIRHQNQRAFGVELTKILSNRISKFGWNLAQVPLTRELANVCIVRQLFPPAPSVLAEVDVQLDKVVDVEGAGLVLGIHLGSLGKDGQANKEMERGEKVAESAMKRRLSCAWKMTTAFRHHAGLLESSKMSALSAHRGREVAWVVAGGGSKIAAAATEFAADLAERARMKSTRKHTYADAPSPVVIVPVNNKSFNPVKTAWLEFYLLSESHACTSYRHVCDLARVACISSIRRNLASGLFLEAIAPFRTAKKKVGGKEPDCSHWHRHV